MDPIRGCRNNKKMDDKEDRIDSLASGVDWWEELSNRIANRSPSKTMDSFETYLKMSLRTFEYICSLVEEHMTGKYTFSGGNLMCVKDQVALAVRRLSSGNSLVSIGNSFGAHHSTVSQITWRFVEAIEETALHHLTWPSTETEMERIKSDFQNLNGLPNCCGAIDITHIAMQVSSSERGGDIWRDRKNNHTMILQAIVDPELRFRDVVSGFPGQMNENSVLQSSYFFELCEKGERLNGKLQEYIVGDSAFPLLPWLITPYQGDKLSEHKVEFNKRHLESCRVAERALAKLKDGWRVIRGTAWRPDKHKLPRVILVCCILHNIVIDMKDDVFNTLSLSNDHDPGYVQEVCQFVDKSASVSRNKLKKYLSSASDGRKTQAKAVPGYKVCSS